MKKYLLLLIFLILVNVSFSQEKNKPVFRFHSINTAGLIEGQAGSSFSLLSVNGFQYKSLFGGIGTGFDFYRFRTIPLFVSLRTEFGKTQNKFFCFANAGTNFYWKKDNDAVLYYTSVKFKNGFYGGGGAGYKFILNQQLSFLFSVEYSHKKLAETGSYGDETFPEKINYNLNRLILKTGIEF